MSTLVREGEYRVVLNGLGGDEMNAQSLSPLIPLADLLAHFRLCELAKQTLAWSLVTKAGPLVDLLAEVILEVLPLGLRARLADSGKVRSGRFNRHFAKKYALPRVSWKT